MKLNDEFYVRRRQMDDQSKTAPSVLAKPCAIKAPRQFGKSSLLIRYLAKCDERKRR